MIQAQYLRLGNWVLFNPSGKASRVKPRAVKIIALYKESCLTDDNGLPLELFYESAALKPIELTEEILLKAGAEKMTTADEWVRKLSDSLPTPIDHLYLIKGVAIVKAEGMDGYAYVSNGLYQIDVYFVDFVHSLQNLIHALTGTELTIEL